MITIDDRFKEDRGRFFLRCGVWDCCNAVNVKRTKESVSIRWEYNQILYQIKFFANHSVFTVHTYKPFEVCTYKRLFYGENFFRDCLNWLEEQNQYIVLHNQLNFFLDLCNIYFQMGGNALGYFGHYNKIIS